jgi:DNA processing protein
MNNTVKNIIALSLIKGIGAGFIKRKLPFIRQNASNLSELCLLSDKITITDLEENLLEANKIIQDCQKHGIQSCSIIDDDYPLLLLEIKDPPPILYYKGDFSLVNKAIGIIGTRNSTELGNKIANRVGLYFSKNWSICNGLVDGIDKHAVVNDNSILPRVIGILSGGLNFEHTCSKLSSELAKKILSNSGLLISEYEPNKKEDQFSGSKASRIQAGLSKALILIQSSKSGGSKYTIKSFSELVRPLAIVNYYNDEEFNLSEVFEANRIIIEKGIMGISEICAIPKANNILISKIIPLSKREDYELVEIEILPKNPNNLVASSYPPSLF